MKILHIAAEIAPICKVGGLADVAHGLSRALIAKKQDVSVFLPKYNTLNLNPVKNLEVVEPHLDVYFEGEWFSNRLWKGEVDGIRLYFLECFHPREFFERGMVYGCKDDIDRFLYFCSSAFSFLKKMEEKPDIVHMHDWHSGALAGLLKEKYKELDSRVVFTIHNLFYQGLCRAHDLEKIDFKNGKLKEGDHYNLLKGGIVYADHVTTVSPNYAKEILNTDLGGELRATLQKYEDKFSGVLNGIDYTSWDPSKDPYLPVNFDVETLEKKEQVKKELKNRFAFASENCLLVSAIARLVPQKGPEMMKAALLRTLELGGQFILLGSTFEGDPRHVEFANLKRKLAGSRHVHLELTYNEELSHLVYAGSDLFLVPSLFEPCGLTQMIAMRYGTVPLVRRTGGLADTVIDGKNGFSFTEPTREGIIEGLDRSFATWQDDPDGWLQIIKKGMSADFSWTKPAEEYLKVYRGLLKVAL